MNADQQPNWTTEEQAQMKSLRDRQEVSQRGARKAEYGSSIYWEHKKADLACEKELIELRWTGQQRGYKGKYALGVAESKYREGEAEIEYWMGSVERRERARSSTELPLQHDGSRFRAGGLHAARARSDGHYNPRRAGLPS